MKTPDLDSVGDGLSRLLEQAEQLLDAAAGEELDAVKRRARDSLKRACGHLRAAEQELQRRGRAIDRAVHDNPWKATAATGLVAFLLGLLLRRR